MPLIIPFDDPSFDLSKISYAVIMKAFAQYPKIAANLVKREPRLQPLLPFTAGPTGFKSLIALVKTDALDLVQLLEDEINIDWPLRRLTRQVWFEYRQHVPAPDLTTATVAPTTVPAAPGLLQKAANLAGAVGRTAAAAVTGNAILASDEEQQRRLNICLTSNGGKPCLFYSNGSCNKCGCILKYKKRLAQEHCPIGAW